MRHSYSETFVANPLLNFLPSKALIAFLGGFLFLAAQPLQAQGPQCDISIDDIDVECDFIDGASAFNVSVDFSWSGLSATAIEINVNGEPYTYSIDEPSGSASIGGFTLPGPGAGYPVALSVEGTSCQLIEETSAIACTPACTGEDDEIGGLVWNDLNYDGEQETEPGMPNVKVEAYDCNNDLVGSAYTNSEGVWSINGLANGDDYRIEFTAQQQQGVTFSMKGPDNVGDVQFVTPGNCSIKAGFTAQVTEEDCTNPDNFGNYCVENFNALSWSNYANGANPFPLPPYSEQVDEDVIYWSRTTDDGTDYTHRVIHETLGGEPVFYALEMDANSQDADDPRDVGVVFSLNRPVTRLVFKILDIDITGDAIDRVEVQGSLGGLPVEVDMEDTHVGVQVNTLGNGIFEGTTTVDEASSHGNVTIHFTEPVDQVAINYTSMGAAVDDPGLQMIGLGDILWCEKPVPIEPQCVHIMDWLSFEDNDAAPMPHAVAGAMVDVQSEDPAGVATGAAFQVDNDLTPLGGLRGFWPLEMDAASGQDFIQSSFTFGIPVDDLNFSILGIDQQTDAYQDKVTVQGYLAGTEVPLSLNDITANDGMYNNQVQLMDAHTYQAQGGWLNAANQGGNVAVHFPGKVDSIVVRLYAGPGSPADPAVQGIGVSDFHFCICRPAPIQLGDYVWADENGNGVQEACESPIALLPVSLYDASGTLLAATVTNTGGRYRFTKHNAPGEDWVEETQILPEQTYYIVFGDDSENPDERFVVAGGKAYQATSKLLGQGTFPYMNDSDPDPQALSADMPGSIPDGLPYIAYTTGEAGQMNASLDAGFQEAFFDLALKKELDTVLTPPPFIPGQLVKYNITVYNEGMLSTSFLRVIDYAPDELELEDGGPYHTTGNLFTLPELLPGDSITLNVTYRISGSFDGETLVNAAEIAQVNNDMGLADQDSQPDFINGNDDGEDDFSTTEIAVSPALIFDLSLEKSVVGNGPFEPGDNVTYAITVKNEGILLAEDVQISDYIPDGLILNDPDWSEDDGMATLVDKIEEIETGASATREITFTISPFFNENTIVNTAEIESFFNYPWTDDQDSTPDNGNEQEDDQDEVLITVEPSFDLKLKKAVSSYGPYEPGDLVTFEFTVSNQGSTLASNVNLTDNIPHGLVLEDSNWELISPNRAKLVTPIPVVMAGTSETVHITFRIEPGFGDVSITNYGEIYSYDDSYVLADVDSTPGNGSTDEDDDDTAVITVQQPLPVFDLSLTKQLNEEVNPGPFLPGQTVAFDITVTNEGNLAASSVQVIDYIPNYLELADNDWAPLISTATLLQPIASIAPGESVTRTITFTIASGAPVGAITNYAEILSASNVLGMADTDSSPINGVNNGEDDADGATFTISGEIDNFDLALHKTLNNYATPGPFEPGSTVTFTIEIVNEGTVKAQHIQISDHYPDGLIPNDSDWSFNNGTATLVHPIASLSGGASATVDITFTVGHDFYGTSLNNVAEIYSVSNDLQLPDDDSTPGNGVSAEDDQDNALITVAQNYDLALSKTVATPGPYSPGQYVTYDITVVNQGNITGTGIQVFDYYPFQHMVLADSDWQGVQGNILRLDHPIASLAPGQSVTVPITFQIKSDVPCGEVLTNCAEIAGDTTPQDDVDSHPADGSHDQDDDDAVDITVSCQQNFDLALEKKITGGNSYAPGGSVTFQIEVTNQGDLAAEHIELADYIPAGLIMIDPDWTANGGVATLNTPIGSLAPGASATVDITFAISPSFDGTVLTNFAEIAGASNSQGVPDLDSTPGNGSAAPNEDDYDGATLTLQQQAFDLALSKSLNTAQTPGPFAPGDAVQFSINITNQGSTQAQNIQLREYIPAGLLLTDPDWTAVGNIAELNLPIASLAAGASTTVKVDFEIAAGYTGTTLTNFAEIGSAFNNLGIDDQDSTPGNGSMGANEDDYDGASISVLQQDFDLALSKTLNTSATPGPFTPGSLATFTLTVTNQGSLTAQTVQLRDYMPLGLILNDNDWSQQGSMAILNDAITNLAPGASASVDITFMVSAAFTGSVINNTAEIGAFTNDLGIGDSDSTPANGSSGSNEDDFDNAIINVIDDTQEFDLALSKTLNTSATPGPFLPGSTVTFTVTVENQGDINAQNIQIRDYVPLGLELADNSWSMNGSTAMLNMPIASLPAGASTSRSITFQVSASFTGNAITNYAEVSAASNTLGYTDVDSTPGNGSAGADEDDFDHALINVSQEDDDVFDLSLHKSIDTDATPGSYQPGSLVTFVITVTNEGNVTAQNIKLKDYFPQGLTPADINWSQQGSTVVSNGSIATLAPGNSASMTVDFVIDSYFAGSSLVNYAEIHSASNSLGLPDTDSTPDNGFVGAQEDDIDDVSLAVQQQDFDLALIKTVSTVGPFEPGDNVTYTINISNQGSVAATFVEVQDFIPNGLTLIDADWTQTGSIATYDPAISLDAGASTSISIDFVIDPDFDGTAIHNYAEILAAINPLGLGDSDSTPGNGSSAAGEDDYDGASIGVDQTPEAVFDLALIKTVSTAGPYATGDYITYDITVINQGDFPAYNVVLTDYIPAGLNLQDPGWAQNGGQATRTLPGPIAAQGGSSTVSITCQVDPAYMGSVITNYAEISAADDDDIASNGAPEDIDSDYDDIPSNDAGGAPNSPADNATTGNGTGQPGGTVAATDEDDHDPAMITLNNCDNLSAGTSSYQQLCLSCSPDEILYDLFGALGGSPSPGGFWQDVDGAGVNLVDPAHVDFANVPEGIYHFTYTVGGMGTCPPVSATVTIEITDITAYACNNQVNVTFGTSCEVEVTPDMVLEGTPGCMGSLQVRLINESGVDIGNVITGEEVGQLLIAEVIDPYCGLLCWGNVWVTDVTPPTIVCPTQEVDLVCNDFDFVMDAESSLADLGQPTVLDNCVDQNTITFTDEMVMGLPDCVGQQINRTFTVTDPAGNSTTCVQEITFRNLSFDDIMQPDPAPVVSCDQPFDADPATGNPTADVTGSPMIGGFYDDYFFDGAQCDLGVTFEDGPPIQVCDGTIKFVREWTVIDWCPDGGDNVFTFTQLIKVGDEEAPVITPPNQDNDGDGELDPLVYSTGSLGCTAAIVVPLPGVEDNCSGFEIDTDILVDEIVPDYNQYGQLVGYDTLQTVFASIGPDDNRFISGIPIGCHTIRYKVTDDCNNFDILDVAFCIEDNIEPVAVCDDDLNISLGGNGEARAFATSIDEGSSDNCEIATMEVRRLYELDPADCSDVPDYYSDWAPYVDFNCCDAGNMVTVELRVTDIYGNQNICWLEVLIEDKIDPFCIAPADTEISCADIPIGFEPEDPQALEALFGAATAEDDCGQATVQEFTPESTLDDCGFGTITRAFVAFDEAGNQSTNTCEQVITVTQEFNYTIKFPKDEVASCGVPTPDTIEVTGMGCDMLSVSVTDEFFYPNDGGNDASCYKIFRRYRVQNMCEWDGISAPLVVGRNEDCDSEPGDEDVWVVRRPNATFIDRDNDPSNSIPAFGTKGTSCDGQTNPAGYWRTAASVGFWEYTQIIEVSDGDAPEISFGGPQEYCSIDQVTCNATVAFPFTVVENCDPDNLDFTVQLDAGANGTIDFDVTGQLSGDYPNYEIGGAYPIGAHEFIVTVTDGCGGNTEVATLPFEVIDCAAPTLTCLNGLTFSLQELPPDTDIDGDGTIDAYGAGIWANDFHINETDCSDDTIAFSVNLVGETPDPTQSSIYFTCDDVGNVPIEVYFYDSAFNPDAVQPDGTVGGPNWDFCQTYVLITDPEGFCTMATPEPMMAGLVARENDDAVEAVEVALSGQMSSSMMTTATGTYEFADLPVGYDYTVTPSRDDDHRNGISTFDLIIIQQHLLGIASIDSPYKLIAADVNRTNSITTLDMIQIQKLILGEIDAFSNNTSWRFVDRDYVFPVPSNPWFSQFPETITINNLDTDVMSNDFIAVKVGDVNNSAATTMLTGIDERSFQGAFSLRVEDQPLKAGTQITVPVSAPVDEPVFGYQFSLHFDTDLLKLSRVEYGLAKENSLGLHGAETGVLTASWYDKALQAGGGTAGGPVLFTLVFDVESAAAAPLSEALRVSSEKTRAEAYSQDGRLLDVRISYGEGQSHLPFRLYQNQPNPFSNATVIGFELPEAGVAELMVFDLNGRMLATRTNHFSAGYNEVELRRDELPTTGIFYYRLQMNGQVATRKMIIQE